MFLFSCSHCSCFSARTVHDLVAWLKILRLRRPHIIRSSPCHPCLHLHRSVPHSHLLPRSFHQEQPLRSSCRSTNPLCYSAKKRSLALSPNYVSHRNGDVSNSTWCTRLPVCFQTQTLPFFWCILYSATLRCSLHACCWSCLFGAHIEILNTNGILARRLVRGS